MSEAIFLLRGDNIHYTICIHVCLSMYGWNLYVIHCSLGKTKYRDDIHILNSKHLNISEIQWILVIINNNNVIIKVIRFGMELCGTNFAFRRFIE